MPRILDRVNRTIARAGDLGPLAARVRDRHRAGHLEMVDRGTGPDGRPVAPLAPSTLKRRRGDGPPRAPRRGSSRVAAGCVISVVAAPSRLSVTKSWPGFPEAHYLSGGTSRMPARPMGIRPADVAADREGLRRHVRGES